MSLAEKTKTALDESRMLMMGTQILLGFQFHAPFQDAFKSLTAIENIVETAVVFILVGAVGLLIAPSARHRIVERGEATPEINRYITLISFVVLAPIALALGLDLFIAATRIAGMTVGVIAAVVCWLLASAFWYGPAALKKQKPHSVPDKPEKTPTSDKINFVLTEARVVLPGAQALLGFQLAIVLTTSFAELSSSTKAVHGLALGLVGLATILLITPAAYHRIVYGGEEVEGFYGVASGLLLAATVSLAFGLSADIFVVMLKIADNATFAAISAALSCLILLGLWHAWPWWERMRKQAAIRA